MASQNFITALGDDQLYVVPENNGVVSVVVNGSGVKFTESPSGSGKVYLKDTPAVGSRVVITYIQADAVLGNLTAGTAQGCVMVDWAAVTIGAPTAGWTVEKSTEKTYSGKTTLKVTATAGAADTLVCSITIPSTFFGLAKRIGWAVNSGDPYIAADDFYTTQLWLNYSVGTTHRLSAYAYDSHIPGQWAEGYVYDQDATGSGHISGTAQWLKVAAEEVTVITLVMTKRAGQAITAPVYIGPVVTDPVKNEPATLTIFMDGNYEGQFKYLRQMMQAHGLRGSMAVVVPWIGTQAGTMSLSQITNMYSAGHEVICHTGGGASVGWNDLTKYPDGQEYSLVKADIKAFKDWCATNGFTRGVDYGVVGFTNGLVVTQSLARRTNIGQAVIDSGMKKMRQLGSYLQSHYGCAGEPSHLVTQSPLVTAATTPATLTALVDSIIARGGWSGITFHDIVLTGATGNNYNVADVKTVIDYIAAKVAAGTLEVLPFSEAMSKPLYPAI